MLEWIVSSTILTAMVIFLRYALRGRIGLRLRYGLWLLVLVRLLVPVNFGTSPISAASGIEQIQRAGAGWVYRTSDAADTSNVTVSGWVRPSVQPAGVVSGPLPYFTSQPSNTPNGWNTSTVWLVGMAGMALWFLGTNLRFARRLRRSRKPLRVSNCSLSVYETAAVETPCLFGLLHPAIYVTPEVSADEKTLRYAVAHETTHYRHKDHIWSILRCVSLALHWYNPLVWWAALLSRRDGELACDAATVARLGEEERAAYGRTLIALSCRKPTRLLVTATTMTGGGFKERIRLLAKRPKTTAGIALVTAVLMVGAVGCTFTGAEPENAPEEPADVEVKHELTTIEDGKSPELAAVLEQLTSPGMLLALQRSEQGVFSLYDGSACPNWQTYTAQLASYRYEPAVMDVVSSAEVWLFPASETGTYRMRVCDDAEHVELMLEDGTVQQFQATNTDSELLVGDLVRMWFDEVEFYDLLADGETLYNQGQDEIAAAQAFCRILEKAHQSVADDSLYRYEFVRCVAEAAEEETKQLRKEGTLGETEWAVSVSTVFVPGNVDAREMALAAGAVPYEGGDPTIPTGAYETTRWVRITQTADGWRGELTGTSW